MKEGTNFGIDVGSAFGTAQSGVGITVMGVQRPDLIIKSVVPVVMAGILGIYGLIISVIINQKSNPNIHPIPSRRNRSEKLRAEVGLLALSGRIVQRSELLGTEWL